MKVVSVIPESFQEFQDHISIVMFFHGCNFKCSFCYNYSTVTNRELILDESPERLLDKYISPMIDGLVLLGGEPTIFGDDLLDFAQYAKQVHHLDVKLFTNGSNPAIVLKGLLRDEIDTVSIDFKSLYDHNLINFKSTGLEFDTYLSRLIKLLDLIYELDLSSRVEVRTTQVSCISDDEIESIKSICDSFGLNHITQQDVSESYKNLGFI